MRSHRRTASLEANQHQLTLLQELDRVVALRVTQQVALKADGLNARIEDRAGRSAAIVAAAHARLAEGTAQPTDRATCETPPSTWRRSLTRRSEEDSIWRSREARALDARPGREAGAREAAAGRARAPDRDKPTICPKSGLPCPTSRRSTSQRRAAPDRERGDPDVVGAVGLGPQVAHGTAAGRISASSRRATGARETEERALLGINSRFRRLEEIAPAAAHDADRTGPRAPRTPGSACRE